MFLHLVKQVDICIYCTQTVPLETWSHCCIKVLVDGISNLTIGLCLLNYVTGTLVVSVCFCLLNWHAYSLCVFLPGHGKFETLGAFGISCMLLTTAGGIAWHAISVLQVFSFSFAVFLQTCPVLKLIIIVYQTSLHLLKLILFITSMD